MNGQDHSPQHEERLVDGSGLPADPSQHWRGEQATSIKLQHNQVCVSYLSSNYTVIDSRFGGGMWLCHSRSCSRHNTQLIILLLLDMVLDILSPNNVPQMQRSQEEAVQV